MSNTCYQEILISLMNNLKFKEKYSCEDMIKMTKNIKCCKSYVYVVIAKCKHNGLFKKHAYGIYERIGSKQDFEKLIGFTETKIDDNTTDKQTIEYLTNRINELIRRIEDSENKVNRFALIFCKAGEAVFGTFT